MSRVIVFSKGSVNVTRRGGGFGESSIEATNFFVSESMGWPGKREHVCPIII